MKLLLGRKVGMTQIFLPTGEAVPVTKVEVGPCQITQVKDGTKDNVSALQIGFGAIKEFRLKKPQASHLSGLTPARWLRDITVESTGDFGRGDLLTVENFNVGDKVTVSGVSKGKGFAGVVKRHHFAGGPASHGHKDNLRAPGSIGAGGVQRVFKGLRMAGHMGADHVTVKNLEIVAIDAARNEMFIKGAVPGARNSMLEICGEGVLKATKQSAPVAAPVEAVVEENISVETK